MTALESALAAPALAAVGPMIGVGLGLLGLTVVWCLVAVARWLVAAFMTVTQPQPAPLRRVAPRNGGRHRLRLHPFEGEADPNLAVCLLALHALLSSRPVDRPRQDEKRRAA
jgi:hypothetical protein